MFLSGSGGHKLLIDCGGMEQGPDEFENQEIPVAASEIEAVLLTHAHIDHPAICRFFIREGSGDRFLPQRPQGISVRSCFVTAPTFRCLRRSGGTGKAGEPKSGSSSLYMT